MLQSKVPTISLSFLVFPDDYRTQSVAFFFEACTTRVCEPLSIVDDNISERIELFSLTLESPPDLDSRIILNPRDGEVKIDDDDGKLNAHIQKSHEIVN